VVASTEQGVVCQLLFVQRLPGEVLLDLVALEPFAVVGDEVPTGTPVTLCLADPHDGTALDQLQTMLTTWADDATVCRMAAFDHGQGQRLCLVTAERSLVVDVATAGPS
jgi:hypothetical protein